MNAPAHTSKTRNKMLSSNPSCLLNHILIAGILLQSFTGTRSWLAGAPLVSSFQPSLEMQHKFLSPPHNTQSNARFKHQSLSQLKAESKSEINSEPKTKSTQSKSSRKSLTKKQADTSTSKAKSADGASKPRRRMVDQIQEQEEEFIDGDNMNHAMNIPTTGVSLADSMKKKEEFIATLTPILNVGTSGEKEFEILYNDEGFPIGVKQDEESDSTANEQHHEGVARIDTVSTSGSVGEEPVRWLVSLTDPNEDGEVQCQSYFMIDIPPYSDSLANDIKAFVDPNFNNTKGDASQPRGKLDAILVTNQECIHYDQSPGVYVTRTSDLEKWKTAFPEVKVIIYRLDQPRECKESVTQVLDGYGPWGWDKNNLGFVETGRPLRTEAWDETTTSNVLKLGELPPDDAENETSNTGDDDEMYSKEAIRQREDNYDLLAVYTPGHTFGSVTYIFPKRCICCSGYALPLESVSSTLDGFGYENSDGETYSATPIAPQGPRLDYQGYLATSVSRPRQMSSASKLINDYVDRFKVVLPSRGDVVFLENDQDRRKSELMENIGLYRKISEIYGRLGITE
jgi:hypothetical protein